VPPVRGNVGAPDPSPLPAPLFPPVPPLSVVPPLFGVDGSVPDPDGVDPLGVDPLGVDPLWDGAAVWPLLGDGADDAG